MLILNNHTQNNRKLKFLIVEDEPTSQKLIELLLSSRFNCEFCSVDNGEEGIAIATNQKFNLIFMNIGLPGIDGFSAAKTIRQEGINKLTPIVATSGALFARKLCLEAGINAFLVKPFTILEFEKIVKKFILLE